MPTAADDYVLHHRAEILAILDGLQRERTATTVTYADEGEFVSRILEVRRDANALVFDIARDCATHRALFAAGSLAFAAELDGVQIGFETRAPALVSLAGGPAALVTLPGAVTRLQRREWFRAALPVEPPIRCTMLGPRGAARPARALDLSCGGLGVLVDDAATPDAAPGSGHALVLSLPDVGPVAVDATLCTVRCAGSGGAPPTMRLGFRFEHLPAKTASLIQRYVQRLEVERLRVRKRTD